MQAGSDLSGGLGRESTAIGMHHGMAAALTEQAQARIRK